MRDLVLGASLFVLLLIGPSLPSLPGARMDVAGAATSQPRPSAAAPILSGAGFAVCTADSPSHLPSAAAQRGRREEVDAPAVLYDGRSVDRVGSCWTEQPQVFLFGYEAVCYDAQDPKVGVLRVRPAAGERMVVLTGPIRGAIAVVADRMLDELAVPSAWVTPAR